jgi:hypothetical protein
MKEDIRSSAHGCSPSRKASHRENRESKSVDWMFVGSLSDLIEVADTHDAVVANRKIKVNLTDVFSNSKMNPFIRPPRKNEFTEVWLGEFRKNSAVKTMYGFATRKCEFQVMAILHKVDMPTIKEVEKTVHFSEVWHAIKPKNSARTQGVWHRALPTILIF